MSTDLMKFLAAVAMYAAWGYLVSLGKTDVGPFVGFTMTALGMILGHASASVTRAVPGGVDVKQGGFARPVMLAIISVVVGLFMLAGCTTTTASIARGYEAQAKAGVQLFDDNQLMLLKDSLCWQPYGAVQRHPEMQPAIVSLCGALANGTTIDPAQAQRLIDIARQLGVTAAAPAASGAK